MPPFKKQNDTELQVTSVWNYRPLSTADHKIEQIDNSYYKSESRRMPGTQRHFRGLYFSENLHTF